jgi:hypothetical protein
MTPLVESVKDEVGRFRHKVCNPVPYAHTPERVDQICAVKHVVSIMKEQPVPTDDRMFSDEESAEYLRRFFDAEVIRPRPWYRRALDWFRG